MESECLADPESARGVLTDSHTCRNDQTQGTETKNQECLRTHSASFITLPALWFENNFRITMNITQL